MANWVQSVIIPVGVAIVTVIITNLTVGPRIAARGKRILAYFDDRYQFMNSILDLLALCANLQDITISDTIEEPRRSRLEAERDRWETQIGEITTWLMDHWQRYALGYVRADVTKLITRYAAAARGIWISAEPLDDRVRALNKYTEPMGEMFLSHWWQVAARGGAARRLYVMLDDLENSRAAEQPEEG